MTAAKLYSFNLPYWYFAVLRIALVFIPQLGYIHPDEYFQSVEALAGKFLDVESNPPWEFNCTFPIRSITIPYLTVGISLKFLNSINFVATEYLASTVITPYFIIVSTRLLMCFCSFIVDYCLYKICLNNNEKFQTKLLILSSSYVMLTYGTRTFSNTVEMILFAMLLYYVCESLTFSNILTKRREYINFRYDKSKTVVEKAKFHKLRLFLATDSLRNCFVISTITVFGFFNRPTFLAFAMFPVFFWLYRGIGSKSVTALQFHTRIFIFAVCSVPSFALIILVDSFYYGYITLGEVGMLDVTIDSFVFTPLNFFKYNVDSENLALHGLHPKFLHVLVNIPLLFNVLGICGFVSMLQYLYVCFQRKYHLLPSVRSIKGLMTLSVIAPVGLLSLVPHQEPRFLIPIVVPLAYLYGNTVYPETDNVIVKAAKVAIKPEIKIKEKSFSLFKLWLVLNAIFLVFYGFLHQGGVFLAITFLSKDLKITPLSTEFHIVTSHIYSIPESFFLQKPTNKIYSTKDSKYAVGRRVFMYEEGSNDLNHVIKKIYAIIESNEKLKKIKPKKKYKIYLLLSSSLQDNFDYLTEKEYLSFSVVESFYPHLSTEAFPDLSHYCLDLTATLYSKNCNVLSFRDYFYKIISLFELKLYEEIIIVMILFIDLIELIVLGTTICHSCYYVKPIY